MRGEQPGDFLLDLSDSDLSKQLKALSDAGTSTWRCLKPTAAPSLCRDANRLRSYHAFGAPLGHRDLWRTGGCVRLAPRLRVLWRTGGCVRLAPRFRTALLDAVAADFGPPSD